MLRICSGFALVLALWCPALADITGPVRAGDGDNLTVGGVNVRLFGIDAPERDQTCRTEQGVVWACGADVQRRLAARVDGKTAVCKEHGTGDFGRRLGVCHVDGVNINLWLVENGWAFAFRKYSMMFDLAEKTTAINDRGLHAARIQRPDVLRALRRTGGGSAPTDPACAIKGNISPNTGEPIFHVPGQRDYARTRISAAKGERWFCSEAQAVAAGWRAARR